MRAEAAKQSAILEAEGRRSALIAIAEAEQEKLRKEGVGPRGGRRGRRPRRSGEDRSHRSGPGQGDRGAGRRRSGRDPAQGRGVEAVQRRRPGSRPSSRSCRRSSRRRRGIFGAVAAPLGNIDKLVVIDQGTGSADGGSGSLGRLAQDEPGGRVQPAAAARGARPERALGASAARSVIDVGAGRRRRAT